MPEWRPLTRPVRLVLDVLTWVWAVAAVAEAWVIDVPVQVTVIIWTVGVHAGAVLWYDNCRRVGMRPWKDRPRG